MRGIGASAMCALFVLAVFAAGLSAQPVAGVVTVNNAGGAQYTSLGAAMQAVKTAGMSGPVVIEVYDGSGPYVSDATYTLTGPIAGISATSPLTIRAAPNQSPLITGNGATSGFSTGYTGPLAINNLDNVTVEGMRFSGGAAFGLHFYGVSGATNLAAKRNIVFNCPGTGIFFYGNSGGMSNVLIENNFVYNCEVGGAASTNGYGVGAICFRRPSTNSVVRHNTVIRNSGTTRGAIGITGTTFINLSEFRYNIVVCTVPGIPCWQFLDSVPPPTLCNYNWYHMVNGATFSSDASTFASWQAAGRDVNGAVANPALANIALGNEDPQLTGISPCIGAATGSTTTIDVHGETRPNGTGPDVGADEYYPPGPTIFASVPTLNLGNTPAGTAGSELTYNISGILLTGPTTIDAPPGVEISFTSGSGFQTTLNVAQTGAWGPMPVYARIAATATAGAISGNIVHTSTGAPNRDVAVSGNAAGFEFTPTNVDLGWVVVTNPGSVHSYQVTGAGLTAATSIVAPAGVELATAATGPWLASININQTPTLNQTIYARLKGDNVAVISADVTHSSGVAVFNLPVTGEVVPPNNLNATRHGPGASTSVDNDSQGPGGHGHVILSFTLDTIAADWTVTSLEFTASGTANEQTGLGFLALYEDSTTAGAQGTFDGPAVDTLATPASGVSFNGPNGVYTATLTNGVWPPATARRFFLVAKLAGMAVEGETIQAELSAVNGGTTSGGIVTGVPTSAANPALTINQAAMTVTLNGPMAYETVPNDSQGPNSHGLLICDVTLTPRNSGWTVTSLTFSESGTMNGQTDLSLLALYVDNGNGTWDGPLQDVLATATTATGFSAANGTYTATLQPSIGNLGVNQVRRFYLVAKLAGTAAPNTTLHAALSGIVQSSSTGGSVTGVPTAASTALMIGIPTLTIHAGPATPTTITREKSSAGFQSMIGQFRFTSSNSSFTISGFTLTTAGSGSWTSSLDPLSGVQIYRDDGDGQFNAADLLLFSGAGSTPSVSILFSSPQVLALNTEMDLWLVLNVTANAGGSPSESFQAGIANPNDVLTQTTGATLQFGTLVPESATLRVVNFAVTSFAPLIDLPAGGKAIVIKGSGFGQPVNVSINGVPCPGVPAVNLTGTEITGLTVPPGTIALDLDIVLETNFLAPKTLTQKFTYSSVVNTGGDGGGGGGGGGGGCAAGAGVVWPLVLLALWRRRRRG